MSLCCSIVPLRLECDCCGTVNISNYKHVVIFITVYHTSCYNGFLSLLITCLLMSEIHTVLAVSHHDLGMFFISIQCDKAGGDQLKVTQFHFTSWPDHGVPEYAGPILNYLRRIKKLFRGPTLVHCRSARIGNITGVFVHVLHCRSAMVRNVQWCSALSSPSSFPAVLVWGGQVH